VLVGFVSALRRISIMNPMSAQEEADGVVCVLSQYLLLKQSCHTSKPTVWYSKRFTFVPGSSILIIAVTGAGRLEDR
jgi:hypothetical protein